MATLDSIADEIGFSRNELMQSMVKFGLTNRDWRNEGLTAHKRLPRYQENPDMATKPPSAAQLAARKKFAEMARNGSLNRKRQIAAKKRKANPDGLYDNINAKRERIAAGSGEKMRRPGSKGAPTDAAFKRAAKTAKPRKSNPQTKSVKSTSPANFAYCVEAKRSLGSAGSVFEMVAGFNTKAQAQNYIDAILASNPGVTLRIKTYK
jgi:hypothetical protein